MGRLVIKGQYSTAVIVDQFEKRGGVLRLHALIMVEKDGLKGILIGALRRAAEGGRHAGRRGDREDLWIARLF